MTHLIARFRANGTYRPLGPGKLFFKGNFQQKICQDKKSHFPRTCMRKNHSICSCKYLQYSSKFFKWRRLSFKRALAETNMLCITICLLEQWFWSVRYYSTRVYDNFSVYSWQFFPSTMSPFPIYLIEYTNIRLQSFWSLLDSHFRL